MKTVLAIGAHPDDIEIGCGGALCLLTAQGYHVVHVVVTSGEEGGRSEGLARRREDEARAAADLLGSTGVIFLREPDGLAIYSREAKARLIEILRDEKPEIVFSHARADGFPDHRVVHDLTIAALSAAAGPWYPKARGEPHSPKKVFGYEVWTPISDHRLAVDISPVVDRKIEALRAHKSQMEDVDYADAVLGLARYRGVMTMAGRYAEVFEVLKSGDLS